MTFGVSSMTAPLRTVALKRPGRSLLNADRAKWHYGPLFDPTKVEKIHQSFADILTDAGAEILWLPEDDSGIADSVFAYDASLMTPKGAILMSPGKVLRQGEQDLHRTFYRDHHIPVIGEITGNARAEAGDTLWLDDQTLIIGRGFRTNPEGVAQLRAICDQIGITTHVFDLPVYQGADACLHLMSLISLVDTKTALVCMPLLPVGFLDLLLAKGFTLIKAPFDEFESSGTLSTNVLALSPGHCVMIDDLPKTQDALTTAGIQLDLFDGAALCIGCEGGPTCLTRPILRGV